MASSTAPIAAEDEDNPQAREQWFRKGREPLPGHTAAALRLRAHQQKMQRRAVRAKQAAASAAIATTNGWVALGPAPLASDAGTGQDYGFVTGRVNAVAIDPADPSGNTVYVGGAFGGLWRSTNAANPTTSAVAWTPLTDNEPTLSFGAIAIQPNNKTGNLSNVILVGTGEANAAIDSYYGLGFLRSADAGSTWTLISTENSGLSLQGLAVSRMAFSTVNTNTVVAAVATSPIGVENGADAPNAARGIYTSTDAGLTWTFENPRDGAAPIASTSATSVVFNAGAQRFFAALRYHGIYSSPDGITWTRLANQPGGTNLSASACPANPYSPGCPIFRAEMAVVPGRNEMYVWYIDGSITDQGIWRSLDSGNTWTQINESGTTCAGEQGCGTTQAFFNMSLAAVPSGTTTDLYAGAVNEFKCQSLAPTSLSCSGGSWLNLTHVYGCNPPGAIAHVHPDEHAIDFAVVNGAALIYFGNDGGIYRALNGYTGLNSGTCGSSNSFDNLNATIGSMTQFVSFSQHPSNLAVLLGGTQDNGSPATSNGTTSLSWFNVNGGDGGYNEINPSNPNEWFTANTDVSIQRCVSGTSCTAPSFPVVVSSASVGGDHGEFYTPYILDPQSAISELLVGTCRVWRGPGAGGTFTPLSTNFDTQTATTCSGNETNLVRSIAAGGPKDSNGFSNVVYATTEGVGPLQSVTPAGGRVFRSLNAAGGAATWSDVTGSINPSNYTISSVAIDPADATGQTAYSALMGFGTSHVFKTTNGGAAWSDFSGSGASALPSAPANTLVIDQTAGMIYVGTDVGVFGSTTTSPNWTEVGPSAVPGASGYLPNVPVTKLRLFSAAGQKYLRASTYGRGIWQYNLAPVPDYVIGLANTPQTIFPGQQATVGGVLTGLNGYASPVNLSCTAGTTPPPATCTLSPSNVTPIPAGSSFSLTAADVIGDYIFNVHGVGTDTNSVTHDQGVALHVVDFNLTAPSPASISANRPNTSNAASFQVTASGSFDSPVALSCSGLPSSASCNFSPSSVAPTSGNPASVSLTIGTDSTTPAGSYPVTITGSTSNPAATRTQSLTLVVTATPDFTLTASGGSQTTTANQPLTLTGTLTAFNGYNSAVNISCTGNPPATCTANPASLVPTSAGASFSVAVSSAMVGTFNFNITATGTDPLAVTHSVAVSLTVTNDFSLSNGTSSQSVAAGQTANFSLYFAPVGSSTFGTDVTYSCTSGLPAGASCAFSPTSIGQGSPATTVTLSISTLGPNGAAPARSGRILAVLLFSVMGVLIGAILLAPVHKRAATVLMVLLLIVPVIFLPSCGGGGTSGGGTPPPPVLVSVSPTSQSVFTSTSKQFTATVSNTSNTQVAWQVNGVAGGNSTFGFMSNTGLYTAPATVPNPAQFNVTAVSQADPTKSASAAITVMAPTPSGTYTVTITATSGGVVHTISAVLVVQ